MRIRPLNDTIIVKLDEDEWWGSQKAVGVLKRGLLVAPDYNTMKKKASTGTILSWGKGCLDRYKVGQRVMFRRPSLPVIVEGQEYRMVLEKQLLLSYEDNGHDA